MIVELSHHVIEQEKLTIYFPACAIFGFILDSSNLYPSSSMLGQAGADDPRPTISMIVIMASRYRVIQLFRLFVYYNGILRWGHQVQILKYDYICIWAAVYTNHMKSSSSSTGACFTGGFSSAFFSAAFFLRSYSYCFEFIIAAPSNRSSNLNIIYLCLRFCFISLFLSALKMRDFIHPPSSFSSASPSAWPSHRFYGHSLLLLTFFGARRSLPIPFPGTKTASATRRGQRHTLRQLFIIHHSPHIASLRFVWRTRWNPCRFWGPCRLRDSKASSHLRSCLHRKKSTDKLLLELVSAEILYLI